MMAKGVKMIRAFKIYGDSGQYVSIKSLASSDNGSILCEEENCRTKVEYNPGHTRRATDTIVLPYLKLAKGCSHKEGCKNSTRGSIEVIVNSAKNIEDIPNIFEELSDGSYTIRLNFLAQTKSELNKISNKLLTDSKDPKIGKDYIDSKEKLASYCRSAAGIARLRSLLLEREDIAALTSLMKIKYKSELITWNNFFYDDERYHVLFNRSNRNKIEHPIAMRVTPKLRSDSDDNASYQCSAENTSSSSYVPWLNLSEELSDLDLEIKKSYIVLANVRTSEKGRYKNLKLEIFNKMQIIEE